jgi:hypothetical protein
MPTRPAGRVEGVGVTAGLDRDARKMIGEIRRWYRAGKELAALAGQPLDRIRPRRERLLARLGTSEATLRHARQFALAYTEGELESLLLLRTPAGLPLSWTHVQALLPASDRGSRASLEQRAAAEGWPVRRVRDEVRRLQGGKRSRGARRFEAPGSTPGMLLRLRKECAAWSRLMAQLPDLEPGSCPGGDPGSMAREERADLLAQVEGTLGSLGEVLGSIRKLEGRLRSLALKIATTGLDDQQGPTGKSGGVVRQAREAGLAGC